MGKTEKGVRALDVLSVWGSHSPEGCPKCLTSFSKDPLKTHILYVVGHCLPDFGQVTSLF